MLDPSGRHSTQAAAPTVEFPEKLAFLFEPSRYKILFGGRGGSKSWGIARALLIMGAQKPIRVLCGREFQLSIADSVHRLLCDQITTLGLQDHYDIEKARIYGKNGTEFSFAGLRHNIDNIKSLEGTDVVWVEEAATVSKNTWTKLIPTIRKEGSEIWVSFNPELDQDETYLRFVTNPPPNAVVVKMNHSDNPFFPKVLRAEMEHMRETDPDTFLTVWEGHCRQTLDGAIYAREVRAATEEGRITKVPYDRSKPVHTFWDLGRSDHTSIWFTQIVGFEFRCLAYYQNRGYGLDHYIKELQRRAYVYGDCWLPHDAENELLASQRTISQQMREAGYTVRITPKIKVADGINAARMIFPNTWFDAEECADGLNCLRRYRYDVDDNGQFSRNPLHDEASDGADAFRYMAVALRERKAPKITIPLPRMIRPQAGGWMR